MEKKRSVGVTVIGIIMLIYSLLWLGGNFILCLPYKMVVTGPLILRILIVWAALFFEAVIKIMRFKQSGFLVGLIYLIASINILKLKKWARLLVVYFSGLMGLFYIFIVLSVFMAGYREGTLFNFSGDTAFVWGCGNLFWATPTFIPIFLFIIFLTRPKVREQFR